GTVSGSVPGNGGPAGRGFVLGRRAPAPQPRPLREPPPPAEAPAPEREPERAREPVRMKVGLRGTLTAGRQIALLTHAAWDDTVSRVCLIVAALSLWLAITLVDVRFLAFLVLATVGLWWRRGGRAAAAAP